MKINKEDIRRYIWWEDIDGNIIEYPEYCIVPENLPEHATYHSCFPLELRETLYTYSWKPKTLLEKGLCTIPLFRKILQKKNKNNQDLNELITFTTHIGSGSEDVILAMANSGDYTLSEAIMLYGNCCERCMNVLAYKYLNGKEGYEEFSDEWKKCNTKCKFCRGDK